MQMGAEQFWCEFEAARERIRSVCAANHPQEYASIDAELRELRDRTWAALQTQNRKGA